jgi:REP element-mobilizing transposase RayT
MSTYTQILYQIVFGSKDYTPFLSSENQDILFGYIAGVLKNKSCHSYIVGGASNHIHIITHLHPTIALSFLVKDIKEASHELINREQSMFSNFPGWQVGFGAFTYHISSKKTLINYVKNQAIHHQTITYKNELINLLQENIVEYHDDYLLS